MEVTLPVKSDNTNWIQHGQQTSALNCVSILYPNLTETIKALRLSLDVPLVHDGKSDHYWQPSVFRCSSVFVCAWEWIAPQWKVSVARPHSLLSSRGWDDWTVWGWGRPEAERWETASVRRCQSCPQSSELVSQRWAPRLFLHPWCGPGPLGLP